MSRHLSNLKRLCIKLQLRFGEDDALYLQVKRELESRESIESIKPIHQDWSISYRKHIQSESVANAHH